MNPERIADVNWDGVWDRQMSLSASVWGGEEAWYERASSPPRGIETSDYADQLLSRIGLSPEQSVLDIGCGNGSISVAIAKRVRRVTAVDSDPRFLAGLTSRVMAEGVSNLRFVHLDWGDARIGTDVDIHDVVMASRCLPMGNLRRSLEQMDRAAAEACYLTWIVGAKETDAMLCGILGKAYHPLPEYGIIYNMLYYMGVEPSVDIFEANGSISFKSLEDAVQDVTRGHQLKLEDRKVKERVETWVKGLLECRDGQLTLEIRGKWALIGWRKDRSSPPREVDLSNG